MQTVRIGFVGAGANTRQMHIPGFKEVEGVELAGVANRSRASGERVAKEFGIETVYEEWEELVAAPDIDAVCIGTWPYMHCPVTIAAHENGKHVLCEARMAMSAGEAHRMLDSAEAHPHLVAQLVPAPFSFKLDATIEKMIKERALGDILTLEVRHAADSFVDYEAPLHWRQDAELSGFNIMAMGIWYETLMRWIGPACRVSALSKVHVEKRRDAEGSLRNVSVPDHVDIIAEMECGATGSLCFSSITGLGGRSNAWLFGGEGTLKISMAPLMLFAGSRGDQELKPVEIPEEMQGDWRVEAEFVGAIRGEEEVRLTRFDDGVRYMEFTEAVTRSAQLGTMIDLPLRAH